MDFKGATAPDTVFEELYLVILRRVPLPGPPPQDRRSRAAEVVGGAVKVVAGAAEIVGGAAVLVVGVDGAAPPVLLLNLIQKIVKKEIYNIYIANST